MGDESNALEDLGADLWAWEREQRHLLESGKWEQKNGQVIAISKMTDQHLRNTIRHIRRSMRIYESTGQDEVRKEQLVVLEEELSGRNNP